MVTNVERLERYEALRGLHDSATMNITMGSWVERMVPLRRGTECVRESVCRGGRGRQMAHLPQAAARARESLSQETQLLVSKPTERGEDCVDVKVNIRHLPHTLDGCEWRRCLLRRTGMLIEVGEGKLFHTSGWFDQRRILLGCARVCVKVSER